MNHHMIKAFIFRFAVTGWITGLGMKWHEILINKNRCAGFSGVNIKRIFKIINKRHISNMTKKLYGYCTRQV